MKIRQIAQLCSWSLGIFLFCNLPAIAESLSTSPQQQQLIQQKILQELAKVNVVYLGETHDNPEDHKAQLKIIQELYQQHPKIAIAMEMFQRPYQGILDRYLAGELSETQLLEQTQYQKRWGFPWEYYAPIVQFARNNHLPVLALNTPAEVTRKVARQGLESLDESERVYIPDFAEIRTDNAEYRQIIQAAYEQVALKSQPSGVTAAVTGRWTSAGRTSSVGQI